MKRVEGRSQASFYQLVISKHPVSPHVSQERKKGLARLLVAGIKKLVSKEDTLMLDPVTTEGVL